MCFCKYTSNEHYIFYTDSSGVTLFFYTGLYVHFYKKVVADIQVTNYYDHPHCTIKVPCVNLEYVNTVCGVSCKN